MMYDICGGKTYVDVFLCGKLMNSVPVGSSKQNLASDSVNEDKLLYTY